VHPFVSRLIVCHPEALFALGIISVEVHFSLSHHYHFNGSSALIRIAESVWYQWSWGSDKLLDLIDLSSLAYA